MGDYSITTCTITSLKNYINWTNLKIKVAEAICQINTKRVIKTEAYLRKSKLYVTVKQFV